MVNCSSRGIYLLDHTFCCCSPFIIYITFEDRQGRVSGAGAPRTPCGVPLGPGWPQDHARMDGPRKFRKFPEKIRKKRKIQKIACDISNESSWHTGSGGHIRIAEFWQILGKYLEKLKNFQEKKQYFVARRATTREFLYISFNNHTEGEYDILIVTLVTTS